jgi:protein-S-isoprenylcysteine O-methyltransferase Ste14
MSYGRINEILWLIGIAYWIITWSGNKKTAQRYNPGNRLMALVATVFVWWILYHSDGWLDERIFPDNEFTGPLSSIICAAGIAFAIWARRTLGRNWSAIPSVKEGHELVIRGPYHLVRHPIYTGILLAMLGSPVLHEGRVRSLLFFAFIAIGLHFKSRVEEGLMMQTFPDSYPEYRRRTKAIIPYIL